MPIPLPIVYNLLFILIGLVLLALFFSWSFVHGIEIHTCGGSNGCNICPDQNICEVENLLIKDSEE